MDKDSRVHEKSAGGLVFKNEDAFVVWLLVRHKNGNHWGFPKGHVADTLQNETEQEAALREVQEETGVVARILPQDPISVRYTYTCDHVIHDKIVTYFLMEYLSGSPSPQTSEVWDTQFVPQEAVLTKLTYENDRKVFLKIKDTYVA